MNGDSIFQLSGTESFSPPASERKLLTIREIGDYELRIYFIPSRFDAEKIDIKPLMTRASLRAGITGSDLSRVKFGEIVVKFNPAIANESDRNFVRKLFIEFFNQLPQVTL